MPLANKDLEQRSSKQPDKRRNNSCRGQGSRPFESSENRYLRSRHTSESLTPAPAPPPDAGNHSGSETITQSPYPPSFLSSPPPLPGLQLHSERAVRHLPMRKKSSPVKKDKKKEKDNRDSHPLNLPPDELRRLSVAMAAQEGARDAMDIDSNGPVPSQHPESPPTPLKMTPGAFPENANGAENGVNGVNGDHGDEKSPTPPPHRVPMAEKPTVDAEAAKAAGNKFFKAKDYSRAIAEYTKG
jgi:DnaJ homolog subfamily C member 7